MLKTDLHIHTIASGHAYSTIMESVAWAGSIGVEVVAITDHGPSMEGASQAGYFSNMDRIPRKMQDVNLLMGCEVNVVDFDGNLDLREDLMKRLDIILAGLHKCTPYPDNSSVVDNTKALIGAMTKNRIHVISHPYRLDFPVDIVELAKAAGDRGVLLELNLSALKLFGKKKEFFDQINLMIQETEKLGTKIVVSSDAHIALEIGDDSALSAFGIQIPDGLVLGSKNGYNEVTEFLKSRG
ncbi:MAG: PHP domain-containing protein [Patescibacteria group bacterium]|jgi:putative hydrolase